MLSKRCVAVSDRPRVLTINPNYTCPMGLSSPSKTPVKGLRKRTWRFCALRDNQIKRHGHGPGNLSFNSGGRRRTDLGHLGRALRIAIPYLLAERRPTVSRLTPPAARKSISAFGAIERNSCALLIGLGLPRGAWRFLVASQNGHQSGRSADRQVRAIKNSCTTQIYCRAAVTPFTRPSNAIRSALKSWRVHHGDAPSFDIMVVGD